MRSTDSVTEPNSPVPVFDRNTGRRLVAWGLAVWVAVVALIRLAGHLLLSPGNTLILVGFFIAVIPLMALVTYPVYWWLGLSYAARSRAATLMSIPGMFLDVFLVLFAGTVFPQLGVEATVNFGAILLFGYAIVLGTGFFPRT